MAYQPDFSEVRAERDALATHVERLREALRDVRDTLPNDWPSLNKPWSLAIAIIDEASAATPKQSLAERDKQVRREALKRAMVICGTLAERPFDNEPEHSAVLHCEAAIRNLMEQEQDDEG